MSLQPHTYVPGEILDADTLNNQFDYAASTPPDTGWQPVALEPGYVSGTLNDGGGAAYRVRDGIVYLRGVISKEGDDGYTSSYEHIATLPVEARPKYTKRCQAIALYAGMGDKGGIIEVSPDGSIKAAAAINQPSSASHHAYLTAVPPYLTD